MQTLIDRILAEGEHIGKGIIKVDGFINHQMDPRLTMEMGREFARRFAEAGVTDITRVITAEVSGIGPALATAAALDVSMVYARKHRPITMPDGYFSATAPSPTKGDIVELMVSPQYLEPSDRVLLIDDFLASGLTIDALAHLISQCQATLCGIGCVVEKVYQTGRERLTPLNVPIVTLARIDLEDNGDMHVF